jgi:hypothetical protein
MRSRLQAKPCLGSLAHGHQNMHAVQVRGSQSKVAVGTMHWYVEWLHPPCEARAVMRCEVKPGSGFMRRAKVCKEVLLDCSEIGMGVPLTQGF